MDADRFLTHSLRDSRISRILAASLEAVEPGRLIRQYLENNTLPPHDRLFLLGIGKAAEPMTMAAVGYFEDFDDALIITKQSLGIFNKNVASRIHSRVTVLEAGHPIPDDRSLAAGRSVLDFVSRLTKDDLLICLISGGGSALIASPRNGLPLTDIQLLTSSMISLGATIDELNILRCQVDELKGGGLAEAAKAKVVSLILSDVIGDNLAVIASGLTVPRQANLVQVLAILKKYRVEDSVSSATMNLLTRELKSDGSIFERVKNVIVANNRSAAEGALIEAKTQGFYTEIINTSLHGEAQKIGELLAEDLKMADQEKQHPFCLVLGGETTVTIHGIGKGGRNQELALAAVDSLKNSKNLMLISLATDGNDGPTDAGGAVVTGESYRRSINLGMDPLDYLSRNDSYSFFERLGDLLKPGYTGTNVNDLIFLIGF